MFLEAVVRPRAKLVEVPASLGDADHRDVKMAAFHHRLQRGENLLIRQIARCAEEDQCIGMGIVHRSLLLCLLAGGLLQVTAEPEAHRRQQPVLIIRFAARAEAFV